MEYKYDTIAWQAGLEVSGMAGNEKRTEKYLKKEERKKAIVRMLACVLCVGMLLMMVLPYFIY